MSIAFNCCVEKCIDVTVKMVILIFRTRPILNIRWSFICAILSFSQIDTQFQFKPKMQYFQFVSAQIANWMGDRMSARWTGRPGLECKNCSFNLDINRRKTAGFSWQYIEQNAVIAFDCRCEWLAFVELIHRDRFSVKTFHTCMRNLRTNDDNSFWVTLDLDISMAHSIFHKKLCISIWMWTTNIMFTKLCSHRQSCTGDCEKNEINLRIYAYKMVKYTISSAEKNKFHQIDISMCPTLVVSDE